MLQLYRETRYKVKCGVHCYSRHRETSTWLNVGPIVTVDIERQDAGFNVGPIVTVDIERQDAGFNVGPIVTVDIERQVRG